MIVKPQTSRRFVPALICLQVEYTGPATLLEYTVGQMMLKNMGNNTDSDYAGMKVGLALTWPPS